MVKKELLDILSSDYERIWKQIKITPLCVFLRAVVK